MVEAERLICASDALLEAGDGIRFELPWQGEAAPAFIIRWQGVARAFLNRCGHIPVELDFLPGRFFDFSTQYLVCATHGALYDPATGRCSGGRCNGIGLVPIPVIEREGGVFLAATGKEDT